MTILMCPTSAVQKGDLGACRRTNGQGDGSGWLWRCSTIIISKEKQEEYVIRYNIHNFSYDTFRQESIKEKEGVLNQS